MKIMKTLTILAGLLIAGSILAAEAPGATVTNAAVNVVATNASSAVQQTSATVSSSDPVVQSTAVTDTAIDGSTPGLRLNFRGVPLEMVLNYLSEAAGFIIVLEARPRGTVDVWSNQPLTKDESVNLLNSVLNKNSLAAIRNGRTLTIVNRDEAKIHAIPVITGSDPETIPKTDQIVTQIIAVRYVEVAQLVKDLQPLVSLQSSITANEAGNAIVMTDTQANIHRVAEVIRAIDMGAEDVTLVRVFKLHYADPNEMADLLTNLFPDDSKSGSGQGSVFGRFGGFGGGRFGGGGGNPFGGGGGGGNNSGANQNQRIKKRNRVVAVADQRTAAVIVTATKDLMDQIEGVVEDLDSSPKGKQTVRIYQLQNADPQEALPVLQDMFSKNNSQNSRNSSSQNSALLNRSTTQNQQNNSASRAGSTSGSRGGLGGGSIGP